MITKEIIIVLTSFNIQLVFQTLKEGHSWSKFNFRFRFIRVIKET